MSPEQLEQLAHERIEALVRNGVLPRAAVEQAEQLFHEYLAFGKGVLMPNGERAYLLRKGLYHVLEDHRIWRKPWRMQLLLEEVLTLHVTTVKRLKRMRQQGVLLWP